MKYFNQRSLDFLNKAGKQKKEDWLKRNELEYQETLVEPMKELIANVAKNLRSSAPGYRFPTRSFARIKRSWDHEVTKGPLRDWFHVSVSKESESRYESLPNLYFHFADGDFHSAGGLYMPSADQTKHIRKWIDQDPTLLEALFEDREFKKIYKELGTERVLKTKPRDYPIDHPRFEWLKLSGWYVWRPIPKKSVLSKNFSEILTGDWHQVLRLNAVLDRFTTTWPKSEIAHPMNEIKAREKFDF